MSLFPVSFLVVLAVLILLCRPYLEAARPIASLALLVGIALGRATGGFIPADVLHGLDPLMALAAGGLALLAAESWSLTALRRLPDRGRLFLLLLPALLVGAVGWTGGSRLVVPLACIALAVDPGAVRRTLSRSHRPDAASRSAPAVASIGLGFAMLGSAFIPDPLRLSQAAMPQAVWSALTLALGVGIGLAFIGPLRIAQGRGTLLALLIAATLLGWGLASWLGMSPLAVAFVAGVVLTHEATRRDLVFTILGDQEKPFTLIVLVLAGAGLSLHTRFVLDTTFWALTAAILVVRPLAWGLMRRAGLSWTQALPMSPLSLPLALFAVSRPPLDGLVSRSLASATVAAFILSETVWLLHERRPSSAAAIMEVRPS